MSEDDPNKNVPTEETPTDEVPTDEYTVGMGRAARSSGVTEPSGAERLGDPNVSGESSALINPKFNEGHGKDYSSGEDNPSQGKDSTSDRSKLDDTDGDEPTEEFPKK